MKKQQAIEIATKLLDVFGIVTIQKEPNSESYIVKVEKNYYNQSEIQQLDAITKGTNFEYLIESNVITVGI